jgi:UDP-N-acetylglucosamine 2-epimerase (non-hydrolysing)
LRSGDRTMPEEINRLLTDAIAHYLFTPSEDANDNLLHEGVPAAKLHFVGNVMIDTLRKYESAARTRRAWQNFRVAPGAYALLTLHRPSNVEDPAVLGGLLDALTVVERLMPIVFPIHPRTRARLYEGPLAARLQQLPKLIACEPLGYIDFLSLQADARLVLTDSGGVQEETTALGVPCLTLRANTERPVTVTHGTNRVVGSQPQAIVEGVQHILRQRPPAPAGPPLWDGQSGARVAAILVSEAQAGWPVK